MKCEKCGHENGPYAIICEKCGTPLKIEENKLLQEKYHDKGKHIDIEEIVEINEAPDFNKTRKKVFKVLVFTIIILIAFLLYFVGSYLLDKGSKEVLDTYSDYMKNSSLALFYFGEEKEIDSLCQNYSKDYGFDYLNIQIHKISQKNKRKMQQELNIYNVTSALVVIKSGVPIVSLPQVEEEEVLPFLQENELVPKQLGDANEQLEEFKKATSSENPVLLYLPTSYREDIDNSSKALRSISEQYNLEYYEVKGYYLSKKQLMKLMTQLGYSEIQEDLILYIVDGKVEQTVKDTKKKDYFQLLSSYDIIDTSSADYLVSISYNKFLEMMIDEKEKYVILIGSNDCLSCDRVRPILGQLANQNQIVIYYLNATSEWDNISAKVKELGVETGLTSTPFMIIVEKGKILDSAVGFATRSLYIEKLTEMGVIR